MAYYPRILVTLEHVVCYTRVYLRNASLNEAGALMERPLPRPSHAHSTRHHVIVHSTIGKLRAFIRDALPVVFN
eukprot:1389852-Amphidinium_carterae.1